MNDKRLYEKGTLITGGAAGIGAACVRRFVAEGARVVIGDVNFRGAQELAGRLGDSALACELDVSIEDSFRAAIDLTLSTFGQLDILVNNAAAMLPAVAVQETPTEDFDRFVDVNLRGVYHGCKLGYEPLKAAGGCVLNISSMAGVTGVAEHAVYAATKGGINALTKSTAVDWGADGIRVNALCPTGVWTETLREWCDSQPDQQEIVDYLNRIHSLGYCPEADEISSVAAFLCSDEAKFVTGCIMPVSGGSECGYKA